jgi:hypothetical protein
MFVGDSVVGFLVVVAIDGWVVGGLESNEEGFEDLSKLGTCEASFVGDNDGVFVGVDVEF